MTDETLHRAHAIEGLRAEISRHTRGACDCRRFVVRGRERRACCTENTVEVGMLADARRRLAGWIEEELRERRPVRA